MKTGYVIAGTGLAVGLAWYFFGRKQKPSAIAVPDPQPNTVRAGFLPDFGNRSAVPASPIVNPVPQHAPEIPTRFENPAERLRSDFIERIRNVIPATPSSAVPQPSNPILVAEPTPAPPVFVTSLPSQIVRNIELIAERQVRRDSEPWFTRGESIEVLAGIDLVL